ncbi:MAG: pyrimidine 5'-nucleotidase [Alphaproteobacteria bacterium]|nr:pyrimidine 5'-nucleotidase [Alphaproteobacteria bacterium]MBF0250643.1 pyrimidine 5'-nucleotidase [Alphaproteobacteria bacterium]
MSDVPTSLRHAETWVFDLDNTLYSGVHGLFEQIDARMRDYLARFLDVDKDQAYRVQKDYFKRFGTTLRGMMLNHGMDPVPYLDYVHDIDVSAIPPAPELDRALSGLEGRKIIFTNADMAHVDRVLARLGVSDHFDGVFDIVEADFVPKPEPEIYDRLVKRFAFDPVRAVMVEDIARNLEPARALGMATVWVRPVTECAICKEEPVGDHVEHQTDDLVAWLESL